MDAITMLKADHKTVEQLFKRFEKAGDRAYAEKRAIVDQIVEALAKHAAIEEQLFYPVVRATVPKAEDLTLESLEEHHIVKWTLSELEKMSADHERFDAKVTVLMESVRHHVKEEEGDLFPMVRGTLGRSVLGDLGDAMATAKKIAPTHPHPTAPDTPPGNLISGAAAGVADRLGDTVSGLAQGSVSAVGDIVAKVLHRQKPRVAATGSSQTRKTATSVRSGASDVADAAIRAVEKAKRAGQSAVKPARKASTRPATKRAATSSATATKKATKRTATTAKKAAKKKTTARTAAAARKTTKRTAAKRTARA